MPGTCECKWLQVPQSIIEFSGSTYFSAMGRFGGHAPNEVFPCTSPAARRYNGVRMRPKLTVWVTESWDPITKKRIWLGSYPTAEMAARAYDAAMVCFKGPKHPKLNFPDALIYPDQLWPCTDHEYIKAIAKAAAYAAIPSSLPRAAHEATHESLLMADTRSAETSTWTQVARPSRGRSHSGYPHDETPLVTHPGVYVDAQLGYPIEDGLIFSHDGLIIFDYIEPGEELDYSG